jgi:hypothetical protein
MIHGGIFPQNEAAFVRFPNKMNFVFSKFMVVSLAEFRAVKLQTLQEMKIIWMFVPKHCACCSARVTKHYSPARTRFAERFPAIAPNHRHPTRHSGLQMVCYRRSKVIISAHQQHDEGAKNLLDYRWGVICSRQHCHSL